MESTRVFIVGFMGAGKTSYGKLLAKRLKLPFFDQDKLLAHKFGTSVSSLFESLGEENFRKVERDLLRDHEYAPSFIFSTGGGCPCFYDNMDWMKRHGSVIYIKASPPLLAARLGGEGSQTRPLLRGKSKQELLLYIEQSLIKRAPFYEQADVTIPVEFGHSDKEILDRLEMGISAFKPK